jgi:hypothetical protein
MSSFQAAALVIGLLVLIGGPALWWVFTSGVSPQQNRLTAAQFRQRQMRPDFEAFQRHFGVAAPEPLKSLFSDPAVFMTDRDDFDVVLPAGSGATRRWPVAWINPIDHQQLAEPSWPGTEGLYAFAGCGTGDRYLIDPKDSDPEIFYYQHESAKKLAVGVRLSEFASAQRNQHAHR